MVTGPWEALGSRDVYCSFACSLYGSGGVCWPAGWEEEGADYDCRLDV